MTELTEKDIVDMVIAKFGKDDSMGETCTCDNCLVRDRVLKALRLLDLVEKRREKYIWLSDKSDTEEKTLQELQNLLDSSESK